MPLFPFVIGSDPQGITDDPESIAQTDPSCQNLGTKPTAGRHTLFDFALVSSPLENVYLQEKADLQNEEDAQLCLFSVISDVLLSQKRFSWQACGRIDLEVQRELKVW